MSAIKNYMALLTLYENNMRVIHWKLAGPGFHTAHERYGGYYEKLGELMDETAEQMITIGENPPSFREAMEMLESADASDVNANLIPTNVDISVKTADSWAAKMFEQLLNLSRELEDDDDLPAEVADVFMDHARWFRIEGTYKLGRANAAPAENP